MLKSFLVPVDGSEYSAGAVGYAAALAGREGARITLLTVVDVRSLEGPFLADLSGSIGITPFLDFQKRVRAALEEKAAIILETHSSVLRERGVNFETKTETGVVGRVICREAVAHDAVVIGRRGEHASWKGLLLGSVVEEVVRGCSRPVIVTPVEEQQWKSQLSSETPKMAKSNTPRSSIACISDSVDASCRARPLIPVNTWTGAFGARSTTTRQEGG